MFKKKRKLYQKNMKLFAIIKYALNKWTIHAVLIWTFLCFFRFYMVTGCKFAFSNDLKVRFGTPCIIQISLTLSILCGDPPKFYKSNCPHFLSFSQTQHQKTQQKNKKTEIYHRNQFISLLRVRDSHWDYGQLPFHQSFRKVSSNYKALSFSFGFTFFSLVVDSSSFVQGHRFSHMFFFFFFFISLNERDVFGACWSFNVSINKILHTKIKFGCFWQLLV